MDGRKMMMGLKSFIVCATIAGLAVAQVTIPSTQPAKRQVPEEIFAFPAVEPSTERAKPRVPEEIFGFPADEQISHYLQNARNRTPIFVPGKCAENEILYPGDHESDWVCDCRPGHIYYPQMNKCYPLFKQGFCNPGEYVDVMRPSMIVNCTKNVCPGQNMVPYDGNCVELNRHNRICKRVNRVYWVIGVNATTLELGCVPPDATTMLHRVNGEEGEDEEPIQFEGANRCSNGTRTKYEGLC
uniref:Putative secreted protein n=1 Tax=Anopheles marajoara TaxID=58244 RepID=A0A2M4BY53_9DIPT